MPWLQGKRLEDERSSVPCGRSVWGIGIIRDPLYFDKRLARLMSKCKPSATGFEDSESHGLCRTGGLETHPSRLHWLRDRTATMSGSVK